MDHARFWSLIDAARAGRGKPAAALERALRDLPPADIIAFDAWFWTYYLATSREDLWAAVYAIRGGCGDDSFDYFRGWLISRGEAAVLSAIRDPETLAELIGKSDPRDEAMLGAARSAYDGDLPDRPLPEIPGRDTWPADRIAPRVKWKPAFYAEHFPALYKRYIEPTLGDELRGSITHDAFWAIIAAANGSLPALSQRLDAIALEELVGFDTWLDTYNGKLMRRELRAACRLIFGKDDSETVAGLRGWILLQGMVAVRVAVYAPDTLLEVATEPPAQQLAMIFAGSNALQRRGRYRSHLDEDELETIPDLAAWPEDWQVNPPSVAQWRERFPRLTSGMTDEQLGGPIDVSKLTDYERQKIAEQMFDEAKRIGRTDQSAMLVKLDQAHGVWPRSDEILAARGRAHARTGNHDAALADFDAVFARNPAATRVLWDRSQSRLARGDHDGAVADARMIANDNSDARTWLASLNSADPKRVRHPKFGEGTVVSIDRSSNDPKLVIDFASGRKTIAFRFVDVIA